jgi:hypothetical protein
VRRKNSVPQKRQLRLVRLILRRRLPSATNLGEKEQNVQPIDARIGEDGQWTAPLEGM